MSDAPWAHKCIPSPLAVLTSYDLWSPLACDVLRETGFSSLVYLLLPSLWPQPMYHLHSSHTKLSPSFHASQPLYSQSFYQGSSPQALGCTMNPLDILGLPSPATSPLSPPGRALPRCFLSGSITPPTPHPTPYHKCFLWATPCSKPFTHSFEADPNNPMTQTL